MIDIETYERLIRDVLGNDLTANFAQHAGVTHGGTDILVLVAGPGSGKTTVLVLRALRHVLVDDILPDNLLLTTFTRKAAKELRTRWLDWGTALMDSLGSNQELRDSIARVDLNRCRIDTLDSIAEQALTENRLPGEIAPIMVEQSAAKLFLKRISFSTIYLNNKPILDQLFSRYSFDGQVPRNRAEALSVAKTMCDRLIQDRVELQSFSSASQANGRIVDILNQYCSQMEDQNIFDFPLLELRFLNRLGNGSLTTWTNEIRALLIDEYQDTNPLQENIYFQLISAASPITTVVGDDDQSMYRFRGGSVELFTQFRNRCLAATGRNTRRIDMITNYRSSEEIVNFYNSHILCDTGFSSARIIPPKPTVVSRRGLLHMPILGLFRADTVQLADELASMIQNLITHRVLTFNDNGSDVELELSELGDLGDFVLLAHSIAEETYNRFGAREETKFPGHFRNALEQRGMHIFNPRGRSLRTITSIQILMGLLLECLDPDGLRTRAVSPTNEAAFFLNQWRTTANTFIASNPLPSDSLGLQGFVSAWQQSSRGRPGTFPDDWPVLELIYKLLTWIPGFQNDTEHQVWLEAISRTIASTGMASPYGMQILKRNPHDERSRESIIRDALLPIAVNESDVDEDIMPSVPRNRLQFMTIHQSKGLEFPLVIVDVGSHFRTNSASQAFRRFPRDPSNVVQMEDDVESHLQSSLRGQRSPMDRTFDDLVRLYYVAYSRPQSVLLLIGSEQCLSYGRGRNLERGVIPNIALGWARDNTWSWRQAYSGRPPVRVTPPLLLL